MDDVKLQQVLSGQVASATIMFQYNSRMALLTRICACDGSTLLVENGLLLALADLKFPHNEVNTKIGGDLRSIQCSATSSIVKLTASVCASSTIDSDTADKLSYLVKR